MATAVSNVSGMITEILSDQFYHCEGDGPQAVPIDGHSFMRADGSAMSANGRAGRPSADHLAVEFSLEAVFQELQQIRQDVDTKIQNSDRELSREGGRAYGIPKPCNAPENSAHFDHTASVQRDSYTDRETTACLPGAHPDLPNTIIQSGGGSSTSAFDRAGDMKIVQAPSGGGSYLSKAHSPSLLPSLATGKRVYRGSETSDQTNFQAGTKQSDVASSYTAAALPPSRGRRYTSERPSHSPSIATSVSASPVELSSAVPLLPGQPLCGRRGQAEAGSLEPQLGSGTVEPSGGCGLFWEESLSKLLPPNYLPPGYKSSSVTAPVSDPPSKPSMALPTDGGARDTDVLDGGDQPMPDSDRPIKRSKSENAADQRKRAPQKCTVCGFHRFSFPGHTNEGWCPVMAQWGSRSRCSTCGQLRAQVAGHRPDGYCPEKKVYSEVMRKRWAKSEKKRSEAGLPAPPIAAP